MRLHREGNTIMLTTGLVLLTLNLLAYFFLFSDNSTATLLLSESVNPKIVSERLGHASITLTLDTYSHVLPDMQRDATDRLGQVLFG